MIAHPSPQTGRTEAASTGDSILGLIVVGLIAIGFVGILKATHMDSGLDVLLCLMGSAAGFGGVYYILHGRR